MLRQYNVAELVYVLQLRDDHWYVGKTLNLNLRLAQHWAGDGAKWTKKHPPVTLYAVYADRTEETATLQLMLQHGYEKVRGAYWTRDVIGAPAKLRDLEQKQKSDS